jgi:hypothetical protein
MLKEFTWCAFVLKEKKRHFFFKTGFKFTAKLNRRYGDFPISWLSPHTWILQPQHNGNLRDTFASINDPTWMCHHHPEFPPIHIRVYSGWCIFCEFLFSVVLGFELRSSHLLGRCATTSVTPPTLFAFSYFSDRVSRVFAQDWPSTMIFQPRPPRELGLQASAILPSSLSGFSQMYKNMYPSF